MSYIFLFYWVCFLKDLCIVQRKVPFISRNKTLVATVWSIKLLKAPPIFLSPAWEEYKVISLLGWLEDGNKQFVYKSVHLLYQHPWRPLGADTVQPGSSVLQLPVLSLLPHPPTLLPLYPRPLPPWVGVHATGSAPQQDWLGLGPRVRLSISIRSLRDWSWAVL